MLGGSRRRWIGYVRGCVNMLIEKVSTICSLAAPGRAVARAVFCRPWAGAAGGTASTTPYRDRERGSHNRARVHASPLVAWRGVGGVGTYSVSDPLPLRKQSSSAL